MSAMDGLKSVGPVVSRTWILARYSSFLRCMSTIIELRKSICESLSSSAAIPSPNGNFNA